MSWIYVARVGLFITNQEVQFCGIEILLQQDDSEENDPGDDVEDDDKSWVETCIAFNSREPPSLHNSQGEHFIFAVQNKCIANASKLVQH